MQQLESQLANSWPPAEWSDVSVVVAVSGGADSVGLLRALWCLKQNQRGAGRLVAGHFNHGLRGTDADEDEGFVTRLCESLQLACEVGRGDTATAASQQGDGIEAAARHQRYQFLLQLAERTGARYVVTAHTADDQAETVLHRIVRGTGLAGLAGMPRARALSPAVALLRPLLEVRRQDIRQYLEAIGQPFRQDESNENVQFTRNRIRHELLPQLARDYNPAVADALLRLAALAGEAQSVIQALVAALDEQAVRSRSAGVVRIDCRVLSAQPRYVVRELLVDVWRRQGWPQQAMGFDKWDQLADLALTDAAAKAMFPGQVTAEKKDGQLTLTRP